MRTRTLFCWLVLGGNYTRVPRRRGTIVAPGWPCQRWSNRTTNTVVLPLLVGRKLSTDLPTKLQDPFDARTIIIRVGAREPQGGYTCTESRVDRSISNMRTSSGTLVYHCWLLMVHLHSEGEGIFLESSICQSLFLCRVWHYAWLDDSVDWSSTRLTTPQNTNYGINYCTGTIAATIFSFWLFRCMRPKEHSLISSWVVHPLAWRSLYDLAH